MSARVRTCQHCAGPILPTVGPVGPEWIGTDGAPCGALNDAAGREVHGHHEPRAPLIAGMSGTTGPTL